MEKTRHTTLLQMVTGLLERERQLYGEPKPELSELANWFAALYLVPQLRERARLDQEERRQRLVAKGQRSVLLRVQLNPSTFELLDNEVARRQKEKLPVSTRRSLIQEALDGYLKVLASKRVSETAQSYERVD